LFFDKSTIDFKNFEQSFEGEVTTHKDGEWQKEDQKFVEKGNKPGFIQNVLAMQPVV
jgi:hypothetical protein